MIAKNPKNISTIYLNQFSSNHKLSKLWEIFTAIKIMLRYNETKKNNKLTADFLLLTGIKKNFLT